MLIKRFIITVTFLLYLCSVGAQTADFIDLGKLREYDTVLKRLSYFIDYSKKATIDDAAQATFSYPGTNFPFNKSKLDAHYFIKLSVTNTGQQDTFWLYMGRAQHYTMYEYDSSAGKMKVLNNRLSSFSYTIFNHVPYAFLVVKAGEYRNFYIQADINFYNWHQFDPVIVLPGEQPSFTFEHFLRPNRIYIFSTLMLLGVMLSMFAYTLIIFFQNLKNEYLYYALSMLSFVVYFSLRLINIFMFGRSYYFLYDLRYQALQLSGSILIVLFISSFLKLKTTMPRLYRHFRVIVFAQLIFSIVNLPITYTNRYNHIGNAAFDSIRTIVLLYFVYLMAILLKNKKEKSQVHRRLAHLSPYYCHARHFTSTNWGDYEYHFFEHSGLAVMAFMLGILFQMLFLCRPSPTGQGLRKHYGYGRGKAAA